MDIRGNQWSKISAFETSHSSRHQTRVKSCLFCANICRNSNNIICRDKRNLVLTENGVVKICDFGFSKLMEDTSFATSILGTKPYMSPELLRRFLDDSAVYSFSTDIW